MSVIKVLTVFKTVDYMQCLLLIYNAVT